MARKGPRHKKRNAGSAFDEEPEHKKARLFIVNAGIDSLSQLQHTANPNPKREGRYTNSDKILLIGEGNFSFALALATSIGGRHIWATSYDTELEVRQKYESSGNILRGLRAMGVTVHHGVDAANLASSPQLEGVEFDKIVFNFPHVGGGTQDDADENRKMLSSFFEQAKAKLRGAGEVHVALRRTPFYDGWDVKKLAEAASLALKAEDDFAGARFQTLGYTPQRTNPAVREAPSLDKAVLYVFHSDGAERPTGLESSSYVNDTIPLVSFGAALKKKEEHPGGKAVKSSQGAGKPTKEPTLAADSFGAALKKPSVPAANATTSKGTPGDKAGAKSKVTPGDMAGAKSKGTPGNKARATSKGTPGDKARAMSTGTPGDKAGATSKVTPGDKAGAKSKGTPGDKAGATSKSTPGDKAGAGSKGSKKKKRRGRGKALNA